MLNEFLQPMISNLFLRAFVLFIVYFIIFRVLLFVGQKIVLFLTRKTESELDDKLIAALNSPLTVLASLLSLIPSLQILTLSGTLVVIVMNIVYSLIILTVARIIYLSINILLINIFTAISKKAHVKVDNSLITMFNSIVNIVLIAFSFLYIVSLWGVEIGPLLTGLGIAGLAVALALQPLLNNIFSGMAVILDGSVREGDLIYLDGESIKGKIVKIGLRSTKIKTFDNEFIIVPNNKLSDSAIQNVALPEPKARVKVPFGVGYGSDIDEVKKMVAAEMKKVKGYVKDDGVTVRFSEMADSSLNFTAYFYVETFEVRAAAKDEANTRIYNILIKNNIEIPFPQMDVNLKK